MSDNEESSTQTEETDFFCELAKQGRAKCKECKEVCPAKELRLAKLAFSPFSSDKVKQWHHLDCLFKKFLKQRATTKRIENVEDIEGFDSIPKEDQEKIIAKLKECNEFFEKQHGVKPKTPKKKTLPNSTDVNLNISNSDSSKSSIKEYKHYLFRDFRKLVAEIAAVSSYLDKTEIVQKFFKNNFEGDITLWCKLLLPGVVKRIYNLQSKQLVKIFSRIFKSDQNKMLEHLEQGDVAETIQLFFDNNHAVKPVKKSNLTVEEVNSFLNALSQLTKEDEQTVHFQNLLKKCTANDLKMVIRLIKHDLRMNAGAKHILDGIHPDAYKAYQSSRDIELVINRCLSESQKTNKNTIKASIAVMTPVLPMLAEACKSVEMAMKKCPNGMFSEIKYDGERVQVHKKGSEFKYFSRSLKPVVPHKVAHFKNFIPEAFPYGNDLILDSEILAIDTVTKQPLPFGSLGKHKKEEYENASVCLYVFDCIYYNGEDLTKKPIKERKKILDENMIEIPDKILLSEMEIINKPDDLRQMIAKVLQLGLEGLVLKDLNSIYEPGKRHWLKVKKDYLFDGAMADTADLIVLGAWYGTGKKGGKMSVFLMGCYDNKRDRFVTVCKVHTGHDDATLEKLQTELEMIKISSDVTKVPSWLRCTKTMIPDFVAKNPKNQPVWEITGAEFTQHDVHTADGISVRFPRVTKIRDDKDWKTATNLEELKQLFKKSKEHTDVALLMNGLETKVDESPPSKKVKKKELENKRKFDDESESPPSNKKVRKDESFPSFSKEKDNELKTSKRKSSGNDESSPPSNKKVRKDESYSSSSKEKDTELKNNNNSGNDESSTPSKKKNKASVKETIKSNLFANINLFVNKSHEKNEIVKDFILNGGNIVNEESNKTITYILHFKDQVYEINRNLTKVARNVYFKWIEDSIKLNKLLNWQNYCVTWKS